MGHDSEAVKLDLTEGLATVRLCGYHGNAINDPLVDGLLSAVNSVEADPSIRGLLLTASGKLFSPGLDLLDLMEYDRPAMARFLDRFSQCVLSLFTASRPVVAALSGHAIAGGCVLAMTADWRVLRQDALIGLNEVRIGVPLPYGIAQILREALKGPRLEEVCLLGRNYSNEEAVATGLAHEIREAGVLEGHARERLAEFAEKDSRSFGITKGYLRRAAADRIRAEDAQRRPEFLEAWFSPGTRGRIEEIVKTLRSKPE